MYNITHAVAVRMFYIKYALNIHMWQMLLILFHYYYTVRVTRHGSRIYFTVECVLLRVYTPTHIAMRFCVHYVI